MFPRYSADGKHYRCQRCGKVNNVNVSLVPSMEQLIFGGFPVRMVKLCEKCDEKLATEINAMIKAI